MGAYRVSIHAPREGCDGKTSGLKAFCEVSIHAPREGCDTIVGTNMPADIEFQFTHPGRGATIRLLLRLALTACFNSRTPGGVRLQTEESRRVREDVSIHAPREGCDAPGLSSTCAGAGFQFTHPGRGATHYEALLSSAPEVSIHAPREGCDLKVAWANIKLHAFQFTHPGRGATGSNVALEHQ